MFTILGTVAIFIIGVMTITKQIPFLNETDTSSSSANKPEAIVTYEEEKYHFKAKKELENEYNTFDPLHVQVGDVIGDMKVIDVGQYDNQTVIELEGKLTLTGDIYKDGRLQFLPNQSSSFRIPIAYGDIGRKIHIHFNDNEKAETILGIDDGQYLKADVIKDTTIEVHSIQYKYSKEETWIDLSIAGDSDSSSLDQSFPSKQFETDIELSEPLLDIYEQYTITHDDNLLTDLQPLDVFRLYYHAQHVDDQETLYALYKKGENIGIPDKETFLNEQDEVTKENEKQLYEKLKEVKYFRELYISNHETVINFAFSNEPTSDFGFRLVKDLTTNAWKVAWLPMQ